MELGRRIAKIRKEHDLTQERLAEICSVTRQTISNWENGKSYPDLETLVLISDTFDVSLDALLKGDRKMVSEITKEQKHGRSRVLKVAIAVIATLAIIFAGICYDETHDRYIPYEKSGIKVSEGGAVSTDRKYKCYMAYGTVTETVNEEHHICLFVYLTSTLYTNLINTHRDDGLIVNYGDDRYHGQSYDDTAGKLLPDIVTEIYYLSREYVKDYDSLSKLRRSILPEDASREEANKIVEQMKADSTLIWTRQ